MKSGINSWSLRARVVFLAVTPVVFVTLLLSVYINSARNSDLYEELNDRGQLFASNLSSLLEFAVATGDVEQIKALAEATAAQDSVIKVIVRNPEQEILYETRDTNVNIDNVNSYSGTITTTDDISSDGFDSGFKADKQNAIKLGTVNVIVSSDPYRERKRNIYMTTAFIAILGLLASLTLALVIGRGVTEPLRGVIETVEALSAGRLETRLTNTTGGELGKLRDGLNLMADTIHGVQQRLKGRISDTVSDLREKVNELELKNIELEEARIEAMRAKDAKSIFLANMSHEIRTPLNAVIGFGRQLGKSNLNSHQKEHVRAIGSAARQLLIVIDDILNFSKLESKMLKIVESEFRIRDYLEDVVLMLSQSAFDKSLEMVLLIDADVPDVVIGDPDRIAQVIVNLANNAIKFTDYGSVVIHVRNDIDGKFIHFRVSDTGRGIRAAAQETLFKPFYQEERREPNRVDGTGLGLVICKQLVELMGGKIGFSSQEGQGSEFYFTVPLETVHEHNHPVLNKPMKVYLLDGHVYSRRAIRNILVHMGVETYSVARLSRLLEILRDTEVDNDNDIVIVSMPVGYELERFDNEYRATIRNLFSGTITVLTSAESDPNLDLNKSDSNIKFLGKPLRSSILLETIMGGGNLTDISQLGDFKHRQKERLIDKTILIVEDNEFNTEYLKTLLEEHEAIVMAASNGIEALELCQGNNFDLIFMDLQMPEMGGIEAAQRIRQMKSDIASVPIIAVTADVFANEKHQLDDCGFTGCLFKPIEESRLRSILIRYLTKSQTNDEMTCLIPNARKTGYSSNVREKLDESVNCELKTIETAVENGDVERALFAAHALAGLTSYFKLEDVSKIVTALQDKLRKEQFEEALAKVDECRETISTIPIEI